MAENKPIYMGLDFSTQTVRIKVCILYNGLSACTWRYNHISPRALAID